MNHADAPLPTQVATWRSDVDRTPIVAGTPRWEEEWLYCLRETRLGDRQVIWEGTAGSGLVGVVDFNGEVRPRGSNRYEGWGAFTPLERPISVSVCETHPVLSRRFAEPGRKALIGPIALENDLGVAIADLAEGLPPAPAFQGDEADWSQPSYVWGKVRLEPESITEALLGKRNRLAKKLGLEGEIYADPKKRRLGNGRFPDLWASAGVVGDVKNQVTATWGPAQVEDYIDQCDREWPEHEWRGVLVQGLPEMAPSARPRLESSRYGDRIEVWAATKRSFGRARFEKLFPVE